MPRERASEVKLLSVIMEYGSLNASELARLSGYSRGWVWKALRGLEKAGAVRLEKRGGSLIVRPAGASYRKLLRVGLLRASEYPYMVPFIERLKDRYGSVEVLVYDEAFKLAYDIALGRLHLGMAPAISHLIVHRVSGGLSYIFAGGSRGGAGVVDGGRGEGHATSMASSMELCAELNGLPHPRVYLGSAGEILERVESGRVRYGVVWEPYLYQARRRGLRVEECDLPFCCLLGGNAGLVGEHGVIARLFEESVGEARRRIRDPVLVEAYAGLVDLDPALVKETVGSYEFMEAPPVGEVSRLLGVLRRVAFPEWMVGQAIL